MAGSNGNGKAKTTVQQKMRAVLKDFRPHRVEELFACLADELGSPTNVYAHLTAIRKELRPIGDDIASIRVDGRTYYQWVRLVSSAYR